jgi:hypothetical protein
MISLRPFTLIAALALAGCVAQGPFPSLAPRPAELVDLSIEPVREDPVIADDAALREQIGALVAAARTGWRDFQAELGATERAFARAGGQGSDSWVTAQEALSRLEASRARTTTAAGELHQLSVARAEAATSPADRAALDSAIEEANAIAARQQELVDRFRRD